MIFPANENGIENAAALLRAGDIVAVPTETVYGLAANALDEAAVRKIFEAKGRPFIDPLIIHVADLDMALEHAHDAPRLAELADAFWPGPLTIILRKRDHIPDLVTAGEPTVAVRVPAHPLMTAIIRRAGVPLAAPSANPFGYVSPTTAAHVRDSLGDRAPHIVDGGPCGHGVESTIIHLADPSGPRVLRPGPVTAEALSAKLGVPVLRAPSHMESKGAQLAPGLLERHYSPDTPVRLFAFGAEPATRSVDGRTAIVRMARPAGRVPQPDEYWFSENGDPADVARSLFALIRHLDTRNYGILHVERAPEGGLGDAINDRLKRAAAKR